MVFGLWCLVVSHILICVHEDQRMVISHSWKQVSSSAIFGKVGWRQCQPVLRWQYHNASITMADVVAIAQLQWDVHNAGLAIYNDVSQTRVTHWSRYHSDVNHSLCLPNIRIAIPANIFVSVRKNSENSEKKATARLGTWVRFYMPLSPLRSAIAAMRCFVRQVRSATHCSVELLKGNCFSATAARFIRVDFGSCRLILVNRVTAMLSAAFCFPQSWAWEEHVRNPIAHSTQLRLRLKKSLQLPLVWQNFSSLGFSIDRRCCLPQRSNAGIAHCQRLRWSDSELLRS